MAPGAVEESPGLAALAPRPIRLRPERVQALLGMAIPARRDAPPATALGMACRREGPVLVVTPPSWRGDLEIEEDLAEEVARLGGYDRVPTTLPLVAATGADEGADRRTVRRIRRLLAAEGLSEMVTLTLTDPETNRLAGGRDRGCAHADRTREPAVVRAERAAPLAARRPGPRAAPEHLAWRRLLRWIRGGQGVRA